MSSPTVFEMTLIDQFRERLVDITNTEEEKSAPFLLRWIRARDHDLDKAEEMLRNYFKWRKDNDVDKVLMKPFDSWFSETYPFWVDSVDKEGRPFMEMPLGSWDVRKITDADREAEFENHICRLFETIMAKIKESNFEKSEGEWPNTQWTIIVDWKGYSYSQLIHLKALQNTIKIASTFEAYYPEILNKAIFVNCPYILPLIMKILKTVVCPKTLNKITCFGVQDQWGPVLLKEIGEEQLGHMYGGHKVRMVGDHKYSYGS